MDILQRRYPCLFLLEGKKVLNTKKDSLSKFRKGVFSEQYMNQRGGCCKVVFRETKKHL
ncbi:hypothetical protein MKHDV_01431 [Halodesulfovibrio sp. MK-HDV]|jgi:hypothetical protein|nr:hypothetical protein MKHDV_01431 [Halodesulfovibrio sp. MK-HDV]